MVKDNKIYLPVNVKCTLTLSLMGVIIQNHNVCIGIGYWMDMHGLDWIGLEGGQLCRWLVVSSECKLEYLQTSLST